MLSDRLSKLLTAYVDGELTSRQRRTVVRLLQRSPEARRLFKKLKGDSMILRGLPRRKLNMDLSGSVLLTINARNIQLRPEACPPIPKRVKRPTWKKWLALFGVAAAVLLAIGTASYLFFRSNGDATMVETTASSSSSLKHVESALPDSPIAVVHDVDPMQTTPPPATSGKRPPQEVAGILTPKPQTYLVAAPRLVRVLPLRDLNEAVPAHQLQQELQADNTFRIDLFSSDPAVVMDRLQAALKESGIVVRRDNAAGARNYSLYAEELTPAELLQVLKQVAAEERKKPICDSLVINALESKDVARALGGEPSLYPPPPQRQGPLGVDLTRPIAEGTGDQILKNLTTPRGDPISPGERQALIVGYAPPPADRYPALSNDAKSFVDARRSTYRPGAVQALITVWRQ